MDVKTKFGGVECFQDAQVDVRGSFTGAPHGKLPLNRVRGHEIIRIQLLDLVTLAQSVGMVYGRRKAVICR